MAVTGVIGIGYVILHVIGNLLVFQGPEAINSYATFLKGLGELLWVLRAVLLAAVVLHVVAAYQLTVMSRAARPVGYAKREPQTSTWASRSMRFGGVLLLVFIVVHILQFTTGTVDPARAFSREDVYGNIVASFRIWWVTLFYVTAMVALGMHLLHGAWASVRTIGVRQPSPSPLRKRAGLVIAAFVWAGFTIVPLAVFLGFLR